MPGIADILDNLQPKERQRLIALYEAAEKKLSDIALHPSGRTTGSQQWRSAAALQRLGDVDKIIQHLKQETAEFVSAAVPAAARAGANAARNDVRRINESSVLRVVGRSQAEESTVGTFNVSNHDAVRVIARDMAGDLTKATDSMGATSKRLLRQTSQAKLSEDDIDELIAGRLLGGDRAETNSLLRDALVRAHNGNLVEVTDRNGDVRHYRAGPYAKMVVRTKTAEAITQGNILQYQREGIDLIVIDGRVSENPCTEFLGKVYSIAGDHPKYPALNSLPGGGPPFHPNCSKGIAAFIEELSNETQQAAAEPEPETAQIAEQWKEQPSKAARTYRDLQRRQAAQQRMKGINRGAGRKQRTNEMDDPDFQERQLRDMGVGQVSLGGRADIGAPLVKAAQKILSSGGELPRKIVVDAAPLHGDPGGYDASTGTVYLNPGLTTKRMADLSAKKGPSGGGIWSSSNELHVVLHEFSPPRTSSTARRRRLSCAQAA